VGFLAKLGVNKYRASVRPFGRGQDTQRSRKLYAAARKEFKRKIEAGGFTPEERAFAFSHDMMPEKRGLYEFSKYPAEAFATDVESTMWWILVSKDPYRILLENKLVTYQLLAPHITTPKIHEIYKDGQAVHYSALADPDGADVFAKPLSLAKGEGAAHLKPENQEKNIQQLVKKFGDLLVTERVQQHPFMDGLFDGSVNCARIMTVLDIDSGQPHAVCATLRVGTEESQPVDNFGSGGLGFSLDMETGQIGIGLQNKSPWDRIETHPDNGLRVTGQTLPGGNGIIQKCLELHARMPFTPLIGWDMAIGADDFVLIEANTGAGFDLLQAHRPLLLDPQINAFYRSLGIL
jgi:hypothetical protein